MKFIDCTDLIEPIMFECKTEWFNKSMLFDNIPVRHIMFHAQPSEREREESEFPDVELDVLWNNTYRHYNNIADVYAWTEVLKEYVANEFIIPYGMPSWHLSDAIWDLDLLKVMYPAHNFIIARNNHTLVYTDNKVYQTPVGLDDLIRETIDMSVETDESTVSKVADYETTNRLRKVYCWALQNLSDNELSKQTNGNLTLYALARCVKSKLYRLAGEQGEPNDNQIKQMRDKLFEKLFKDIPLSKSKPYVLYGWIAQTPAMLNDYYVQSFNPDECTDKLLKNASNIPRHDHINDVRKDKEGYRDRLILIGKGTVLASMICRSLHICQTMNDDIKYKISLCNDCESVKQIIDEYDETLNQMRKL